MREIMGEKECKTIIFTETKRRADELTFAMKRDRWPARFELKLFLWFLHFVIQCDSRR